MTYQQLQRYVFPRPFSLPNSLSLACVKYSVHGRINVFSPQRWSRQSSTHRVCACYAAVATSKKGTHALKEDHGEQSHETAFQEPAAMTTPALAHHHLPEYDGERDNWRAYVIKAEAYFEATGVTDTARKRALLVAALNTKTVQILAGRVAPKKPNSLTYEEVVATLNEYFDPKRHEITESFRFFNRCQHEVYAGGTYCFS